MKKVEATSNESQKSSSSRFQSYCLETATVTVSRAFSREIFTHRPMRPPLFELKLLCISAIGLYLFLSGTWVVFHPQSYKLTSLLLTNIPSVSLIYFDFCSFLRRCKQCYSRHPSATIAFPRFANVQMLDTFLGGRVEGHRHLKSGQKSTNFHSHPHRVLSNFFIFYFIYFSF